MKYLFKANKNNIHYLFIHHWPLFVLEIVFAFVAGVSGAVSAYFSKAFINLIVIDKNLQTAIVLTVAISLFYLFRNILQSLLKVYSGYAFSKVRIVSKLAFADKTKQLNLSFFDIPDNRNCLTRADKYASDGTEQLITYCFSFLSNIIGCVSILYLLSSFEWWIIVFLSSLMLYKLIIDTVVSKKNYKFKKERVIRERRIGYYSNAFKNSSILVDLHIFDGFKLFKNHFKSYWNDNLNKETRHNIKMELLYASTLCALLIQNIVLYYYAGNSLFNGTINVGEFTLFFSATGSLNTLLLHFKNSISSLFPMILEAKNYREFVEIDSIYKFKKDDSHLTQIEAINTIEFQHVSFRYPEKENCVLSDVSFLIQHGEIVSLVGLNGCGKTTIIKLLLKLYDVTEGQILINGIPLQEIETESYWKLCSTVFQQFNIFPISAVENISLTEEESSDIKAIEQIMQNNGIYERLEKEKAGVFTPLSRDYDSSGTYLSGGEKQKIVLSRASYKKSSLLILDEPSSALDAQAEQELFDYIRRGKNETTISLFVSHRLSTSILADKIIYIEKGRVSCCGDHDYMIKHCMPYKDLYEMQLKRYFK